LPPVAEDRTWIPQTSAKIKSIRREAGTGLVTVEVFNAEDVDVTPPNQINARKGNDQFLNGLKVGHLVTIRDVGPGTVNKAAFDAFKAAAQATKFAVTAVGHMDGDDFEPGPDEDGNYYACQYVDTENSTEALYENLQVGSRNQGLWFDTVTGWMAFLESSRDLRTMFLAAHYPIQCWHGREYSGYLAAGQPQYRLEVFFHALLHGEAARFWYNAQGAEVGYLPIEDIDQRQSERNTLLAMRELDVVCPYKVLPLSINYAHLSMQRSDYVVSGASLPGGKRIFRVTLKDEQLVATNGDRLYPKLIGPIGGSTDFVDFRTNTGRILRVPGQLVPNARFEEIEGSTEFCEALYGTEDEPPASCATHEGSWFTDFGWWVECEAPT
jgi:hypothetical protein